MADEYKESDSCVEISSSEESDEPCLEIERFLPLRLQDLCLIAVINQLDSHSVESLVLLPRHLRYRLLTNLPKLDLCTLDSTPVAEGIDIHNLWKSKSSIMSTGSESDFTLRGDLFMETLSLSLACRVNDVTLDLEPELLASMKQRAPTEKYLLDTTLKILSNADNHLYADNPYSQEKSWLLAVAGHTFLQDAIRIPGAIKLKNMYGGSDERDCNKHESDYDGNESDHDDGESDGDECESDCDGSESIIFSSYVQLWKKQAIPFAKFKIRVNFAYHDAIMHILVPHRLLPIYKSNDPVKLLETAIIKCGLQPANLRLSMYKFDSAHAHLKELYSNQGRIEEYKLLLRSLFRRIVVLVLREMRSNQVDALMYISEAVIGDGKSCVLKALEINPCDRIWDNVGSSLNLTFMSPYFFTDPPSQPNYQALSVLQVGLPVEDSSIPHLSALLVQQHSLKHVSVCLLDACGGQSDSPVPPTSEEKQLYNTLAALCLRENLQTLRINFACRRTLKQLSFYDKGCNNFFPFTEILQTFMQLSCPRKHKLHFAFICCLPPKQLPPLPHTVSGDTVPECGVQHKILDYEITDTMVIVPHLLQLPVIRLQELAFSFEKDSQEIFHQVAHHPNLHVARLLIHIDLDPADVKEKEPFSTLSQDFARLFQVPTLIEIWLCGEWIYYSQVRNALLVGLQQQSRICSLQKIQLEERILKSSYPTREFEPSLTVYTETECKDLWSTIFSFPHLQNLEIELSNHFTSCFFNMLHVIVNCFKQFAKTKLKLLQLNMHEDDDMYYNRWEEVQGFMEIAKELNVRLEFYRKAPENIYVTKDLF